MKKQLADLEESKIKQISDSNDKAAQIKKQMEELQKAQAQLIAETKEKE